jgi:hypothetical protein
MRREACIDLHSRSACLRAVMSRPIVEAPMT